MSEKTRHILYYILMVIGTFTVLALAKPSWAVPLQPWEGGTGCENGVTVAELPASPLIGTICVIIDAQDEYDITVGGGNKTNLVIYMGDVAGGVDFGWKQLDLNYTEVSDSFYVTQGTAGVLPKPSVIPSCRNGTNGGVLEYNTSTHAFACVTTTKLNVVSTSSDVTTGLCFWSTSEGSIQCGNTTGVRTMLTKAVAATTYLALDGSNILTGGITFEGATPDAWETTLNVVDPTSPDKTINLPNASGTVAVSASGSLALSATGDVTLSDDGVTEAKLKAVDAPADEECLTYESTVGDFEWQACGGGGIDEATGNTYWIRLDGTNDPITGDIYFQAGAQLSIGANVHNMTINGSSYDSLLATHIDDGASTQVGIEMHRAENTTASSGPTAYGARSRGTLAAETVVSSGDHLLNIAAFGYDGTDYALSSRIDFEVGGTPGANDMPGRIVLRTSADGTQSPSDRLVVESTGEVLIEQAGYLSFEGATDDGVYTTITATDPTSARTIVLPNASGTVAVSASGIVSLSAAGDISIADSAITEAKLKAVNGPTDEYCLTYETTTGDFEWQDCATSVGTGTFLKLDASNDPVTGRLTISGSSTVTLFEVVNSQGSGTPAATFQNDVDAASNLVASFYGGNRTTAANGDYAETWYYLEDSSGSQSLVGKIRWTFNDVTTTTEDGGFTFIYSDNGVQTEGMRIMATTASQGNVVINEGSNDVDFRVETDNRVNMIDCDAVDDSCTFGTSTEIAFVGIDGQADEIQFAIQGHSTQTSNVFLIENSSGTDAYTMSVGGIATMYNSEATAGLGMPYQVANVALTAQAAGIGATTLYSPTVDTTVMVKAYTIVTQAATTSSTLGSVGLVYTDADNATSQTVTMRCNNRTGTSVTSVTGNSLTTSLQCEGMFRVNGGTSMTYNMGYASSGATPMQYSLYIVAYAVQQ